MEFNLADLFEGAVDAFADREYLVAEGQRRTYAEMDARANRLAHHLAANGIGPGDHVGIYAYNSVEWVETLWAVFKLRAVWININYRYVEEELAYLFENADLKAVVFQREFAPRVARVLSQGRLPLLTHSVVIDDGTGADLGSLDSVAYEDAMASGHPERDFEPRAADDLYMLYTGGTTGLPKGVVWRHEDVFFALGGGIDPTSDWRAEKPIDIVEKGKNDFPLSFLPIAPLMHGATQWGVMGGSFVGRKTVLVAKFRPSEVWQLVEQEKVNGIFLTGDAMGRPLIEELDRPGAGYDTSSLLAVSSSAAIFSSSVKEDFFRHFPNLIVTDAIGASESGTNGIVVVSAGKTAMKGGPTVNRVAETVVLDEDGEEILPGSDKIGFVARTGHIPIGYYKDEAKTAATFRTFNGVRYSIPGDYASVEADGTITLLGRGSVSINSGGEKIFPEEVEGAVKSHAEVFDAVVVGVTDERWGQRVAAVIEVREGTSPTLASIQEHCRTKIAGYKLPRQLHVVSSMVRSPSGKPDYRWAKEIAETTEPVEVDAR
jgi:3-oxocholest-4-en-26-oate---CoA ligase